MPAVDAAMPADDDAIIIETPRPAEWLSRAMRCHRSRGRSFCDGPRRAPAPHGAERALAESLGLGTYRTAAHLLGTRAALAWVEAAGKRPAETLRWPVPNGRFGRGFGRVRRLSRSRAPHLGIDISAPGGSPVVAINDGIVAYSDNEIRGYGNLVLVVHPDGSTSLYAHLREAHVFAGQRVLRGQTLGLVGMTGLAQGPHLHFEWHHRGRPRDPMPRFASVVRRDGELVAQR
jgi:murein DD-endopeptidase MepM/ murein hydrolase activator NlpD